MPLQPIRTAVGAKESLGAKPVLACASPECAIRGRGGGTRECAGGQSELAQEDTRRVLVSLSAQRDRQSRLEKACDGINGVLCGRDKILVFVPRLGVEAAELQKVEREVVLERCIHAKTSQWRSEEGAGGGPEEFQGSSKCCALAHRPADELTSVSPVTLQATSRDATVNQAPPLLAWSVTSRKCHTFARERQSGQWIIEYLHLVTKKTL